jgi:integrase
VTVKCTRPAGGRKVAKPNNPRPDFPLYPHLSGKWAKTIRGKTYYFGAWDNPEGALSDYLDQKDDLYAGRTPGTKGGATIQELCNAYMVAKRVALDSGSLSPRSFVDYDQVCRWLLDQLGATRSALDLGPSDFEKLYAHLACKHGASTLGREVTVVRSILKYAVESDLIQQPVKFGPQFRVPSKQTLRKAKAKAEHANGTKLFTSDEVRRLIDSGNEQVKAMILLAINGGLGNSDVSNLPLSAVNLKNGWLEYPRVKTGINRRIPLWPETVAALQTAIANRRQPTDSVDADLVFITSFGQRWVRYEVIEEKKHGHKKIKAKFDDAISKAFGRMLDDLGTRRPRIGFYTLRHTFETVAGRSRDQVAVDAIMGHADPSTAAEYRHGLEDNRLRAVVGHVHGWLFGDSKGGQSRE